MPSTATCRGCPTDGEDDEAGAEGGEAATLLRAVATAMLSHQISAAGAPRRTSATARTEDDGSTATARKEVCAHGRRRGARDGGTTGGARAREEGEGGARVPIYSGRPGDAGQEEGLCRRWRAAG